MDDTRKFVKTELHDPDALLFFLSHDGVDAVTKAALKAYRRLRTNGNAVRVDYDVSKAQRGTGFGRLYAEGASLQSFSRDVRGALAGKLYLEVDAVNAHPTMLERLCETRGWHHTALRRYVGEREALLVSVYALYGCSRSIAKELFLTLSFGGALGRWCASNGVADSGAGDADARAARAFLAAYAAEMVDASGSSLNASTLSTHAWARVWSLRLMPCCFTCAPAMRA